jgi:hypothetical protein
MLAPSVFPVRGAVVVVGPHLLTRVWWGWGLLA